MSDIVEKLRKYGETVESLKAKGHWSSAYILEQADTITNLRAEVERLRGVLEEIEGGYKRPKALARSTLAQEPPLAALAARQVEPPAEEKAVLYGNLDKLYVEPPTDEPTEVERLRGALEKIDALDDQAECCGNGTYSDSGDPPECCNQPIYGLDRAKIIAHAALTQEARDE